MRAQLRVQLAQETLPDLAAAQERARGMVKNIMRRYPDEVDDVLQMAALKALQYAGTFRHTCRYSTWFCRIAANTALMQLRRHRTRLGSCLSLHTPTTEGRTLLDELSSPDLSQHETFSRERQLSVLHGAIASLTPALREEARLLFEGRPPLNDNARKSRSFRLRRNLRPILLERLGTL